MAYQDAPPMFTSHPGRPFGEDGYCVICGNGWWKRAHGDCTVPNSPAQRKWDDTVRRFREYETAGWGSLHVVMDDGNLERTHVLFCYEWARSEGDKEGQALAALMLTELDDGNIAWLYRTQAGQSV
jgi:hypothetical protein